MTESTVSRSGPGASEPGTLVYLEGCLRVYQGRTKVAGQRLPKELGLVYRVFCLLAFFLSFKI